MLRPDSHRNSHSIPNNRSLKIPCPCSPMLWGCAQTGPLQAVWSQQTQRPGPGGCGRLSSKPCRSRSKWACHCGDEFQALPAQGLPRPWARKGKKVVKLTYFLWWCWRRRGGEGTHTQELNKNLNFI